MMDYPMKAVVVSGESLFKDGLLAIMRSQIGIEIISHGDNVRDALKSAGIAVGAVVVVDLRGVSERDLDYLIGAQEFGGFATLLISDESVELPEEYKADLSRSGAGADLLSTLRAKARSIEIEAREKGFRLPSPERRGRGRPRSITGNLPLSPREYEAASLIAKGSTNAQIAEAMGLKEQSVKNLVTTISRKLKCANRVQVAREFMANATPIETIPAEA
jgi:DNA-binding NarL/FixJ family response regulator